MTVSTFTVCEKCQITVHTVGDGIEVATLLGSNQEWRQDLPCVAPLCGGRARIVSAEEAATSQGEKLELPIQAYFRALHGFGLPTSSPATLALVSRLLCNQQIVGVVGHDIGSPERTIIERIILEDGTRLHFAASARGACIYHVEAKPRSHVEVFDESQRDARIHRDDVPEGAPSDGAPDREEARRGLAGHAEAGPSDAAHELGAASLPGLRPEGGVHPGTG